MQPVLERGSIEKNLTFDVGLIQLSFHIYQSVYLIHARVCTLVLFIVVCKKYYLDVVLNELSTTDTYVHDDRGSQCVILDHLQYMTKMLNLNMKIYHPFTGYLSYIRTLMGKGLLQRQIDVLLNRCLNCLLLA